MAEGEYQEKRYGQENIKVFQESGNERHQEVSHPLIFHVLGITHFVRPLTAW